MPTYQVRPWRSDEGRLYVREETSGTGDKTGVLIEQEGVGDALLRLRLTGAQDVLLGIDNNDGDKFKAGFGPGLHTSLYWECDTDGSIRAMGGHYRLNGGPTSAPSNDADAHVYRSSDGAGAYPFNNFGHLILQPRTTLDRDVVVMSGATTPSVIATFVGADGSLRFGVPSDPGILKGAQEPEGAVTAPVGSVYLRTQGNLGSTFYRKEAGSGDTGWVGSTATNGVITSDSTVANTTSETTIYTEPIPANTLHVGQIVKCRMLGRYSTANGTDTFTATLKVGGTAVDSVVSTAGNVTDGVVDIEFIFTVRSIGVTGTIQGTVLARFNDENKSDLNAGTTTIDTTAADDVTLNITWSAADPGNTVTIQQGWCDFLN